MSGLTFIDRLSDEAALNMLEITRRTRGEEAANLLKAICYKTVRVFRDASDKIGQETLVFERDRLKKWIETNMDSTFGAFILQRPGPGSREEHERELKELLTQDDGTESSSRKQPIQTKQEAIDLLKKLEHERVSNDREGDIDGSCLESIARVMQRIAPTDCSPLKKVTRQCDVCHCHETLAQVIKKCGGCQKRLYCSKACQRRDWPSHKAVCKVSPPSVKS